MLMAPNTGKRGEKRIEGGDELDARQGVDSSAHLKLEEDTVLTAGSASRRGTRLSSIHVLTHPPRPGSRSCGPGSLDCARPIIATSGLNALHTSVLRRLVKHEIRGVQIADFDAVSVVPLEPNGPAAICGQVDHDAVFLGGDGQVVETRNVCERGEVNLVYAILEKANPVMSMALREGEGVWIT